VTFNPVFPPESTQKEVCAYLNVSRETEAKLEIYVRLLEKWQQRINLVSSKTLPFVWQRHILDSAQLITHLPNRSGRIMDIGTGAGLPGVILAILTECELHLVESDTKKVAFMRTALAETDVQATIHHSRIEDLPHLNVDVITARALAPLSKLMQLTQTQDHLGISYLFLKGKGVDQELTDLSTSSTLIGISYPSITDQDASIIYLKR
jgi:16S rRNA (guanine527-N7)-methyltransferase